MIKKFENFNQESEVKEEWYENGQKWYEEWYLNGKYHKEDGPAFKEWYENGQKQNEFWYLNGKEYSKEDWIEMLKKINSHHYEEQKMLYDMEKYNL